MVAGWHQRRRRKEVREEKTNLKTAKPNVFVSEVSSGRWGNLNSGRTAREAVRFSQRARVMTNFLFQLSAWSPCFHARARQALLGGFLSSHSFLAHFIFGVNGMSLVSFAL